MKNRFCVVQKKGGLFYGLNPVRELVEETPSAISAIIIPENHKSREVASIIRTAESRGIRVKTLSIEEFSRLEKGRNYQKIAAEMKEFRYVEIEDVLKGISESGKKYPLIVALDSVTDPQNFGAITRTACFFGADCVIIPKDRSVSVTPAVIKASSGAVFRFPIVRVVNLARTLDRLYELGFLVVGADVREGIDIREARFEEPLVIVFGSEGVGMRRLVKEKCQRLVNIPSVGFESLNVSVAAGIIIYSLKR